MTVKKKLEVGRLATLPPTATTTRVTTQRMKCETTPLGANAAAGRFRIFKEGKIQTDYGLSIMNPSAGRAVIKVFQDRGNDMMIDLRHFSIAKNATREQSEAMGWIPCPNGLEYVDGDGLYAVNVKWAPEVKAGLESDPPKWKYFSPLYDQDAKTKVITSLSNVALTNMPATHGLNRLAAEIGGAMDLKLAGLVLVYLMAAAEAGDEKAIAARDSMISLLGDNAQAAVDAVSSTDEAPASAASEELAMSEEDKTLMASMNEDQKVKYMAGMKAMSVKAEGATDKVIPAEAPKDGDKKDETVATEAISAEMLLLAADGELAKSQSNRQTIVAELRTKGLIAAGGKVEQMLLSPGVSDGEFAKFVAAKRSKTVTMGGPAPHKIVVPKIGAKSETQTVSAEMKAQAEAMAKRTGSDPKKLLAKLVEIG